MAVEAARSIHPGTRIALAPLGDQLLARLMKHDPGDRAFGWCGWAAVPSVDRFSSSAPAATAYKAFGLIRDHGAARARTLLGR
ncbi:hypothetical protein E0H73_41880 [Kribbella pittospori]|uniref:Uncharacterized protein n=1 Tax=Kribbella pittospori TaxID=722689 RepID=A0A4R0JSM5_9ACTN|nr:hypothetical protein [Kribbella pittospori]TCC50381.1 hypothetical protein E0H73_41880 [Kribbella pittospori]